jgi:spermidine synthase
VTADTATPAIDPPKSARLESQRLVLTSCVAAAFSGALLVFLVQPIVARMVLPDFGGAASVWITAMLFFQVVLLAGYGYAHLSVGLFGRRQPFAQMALIAVAAAALPVGRHLSAPPDSVSPSAWLLAVLLLSVGAPFFVVTTAAPTIQRWFAASEHPAAGDPYFLYAASNAGSLLALLAYPLLVEPRLSLHDQARAWTVGYACFAVLSVVCVVVARPWVERTATAAEARSLERITWALRARWVVLAFVPSSLLLGVTTFITTDVAAVPLLWVAPLAVYLVTFIVAFARRRPIGPATAGLVLVALTPLVVLSLLDVGSPPIVAEVGVHLAFLFFAGCLVHGRLADERPQATHLTEFYVLLALGGALGGVFNALVAPVIFDSVVEYPLAIVLALLLRPSGRTKASGRRALLGDAAAPFVVLAAIAVLLVLDVPAVAVVATVTFALIVVARRPSRFALGVAALLVLSLVGANTVYRERTFFGVLDVVELRPGTYALRHGTTLHGAQRQGPGGAREPLSYYHPASPIGQLFPVLRRREGFDHVSVIGLGVGSLAAYGRPGEVFTFYELDPAVVRIASDTRYFRFLAASPARVSVVVGDGRRRLAEAPNGREDLIVVDAFSSDAIPVHLLTREAVELYFSKLASGGVIAFHVSNAHLRLAPVLAAIARDTGAIALERVGSVTPSQARVGLRPSDWVVLARDTTARRGLSGWQQLAASSGRRAWTDDYSNVLSVLK